MTSHQHPPNNLASQSGDEMPRTVSRRRRILFRYALSAFVLLVLAFVSFIWGHLAIVRKYNLAFSRIQRGDRLERVIEKMGTPSEVEPVQNRVNNAQFRYYIYRVYPFPVGENLTVRHEWAFAIDESGRVVWEGYSDDAC